jgi:hypothetical protein
MNNLPIDISRFEKFLLLLDSKHEGERHAAADAIFKYVESRNSNMSEFLKAYRTDESERIAKEAKFQANIRRMAESAYPDLAKEANKLKTEVSTLKRKLEAINKKYKDLKGSPAATTPKSNTKGDKSKIKLVYNRDDDATVVVPTKVSKVSNVSLVKEMIKVAKNLGIVDPQVVVNQAADKLGITVAQAKRYVKDHWAKCVSDLTMEN